MARIITVYINAPRGADTAEKDLVPSDMSYIRWFRISEALSRRGHEVDIAVPDRVAAWAAERAPAAASGLRRVALSSVDWQRYDVIKTLFHRGFETLAAHGGADHPFIIAKLGSVVGPTDMPGVFFYGENRRALYATQERLASRAKYVTLLSDTAAALWRECFGERGNVLVVPGGVDAELPATAGDPYPGDLGSRCLFAGHVYGKESQPEANEVIIEKLNVLGKHLAARGARLYMIGSGDISRLEPAYVTHLGVAKYDASWDYLRFADVGVVVQAGEFMHNNESSKIYHYLRAGLPVVTERGFPNDHIVTESGLGDIVDNGDMEQMAERCSLALRQDWDRARAIEYVVGKHSWDARVATYHRLIEQDLPVRPGGEAP